MTTEVILRRGVNDAHDLWDALAEELKKESGVLDIETSDGDTVTGFAIVEHTLTDGSKVRSLVLEIGE